MALLKSDPALGGVTNAVGLTPAQTAVVCGQTRVLASLLEQQLPPDPPTAGGSRFTALHVAAVCNRTNEAALLIRHGADVSALDYVGAQPLHYAATGGAAELLALLLQHGAKPDVPVQTPEQRAGPLMLPAGTTALHLAAMGGHTNAVAVLLLAGANVNSANAMGLTPVDLAHYSGNPTMSFGLRPTPLGLPGTRLRLLLSELGVADLKLSPLLAFPPLRQAVIAQLEQAGAERGKPVSSGVNQPWSPGDFPGRYR